MTPSELSAYLKALRDGKCMSAELVLPGGATIRAVFAPEMPTYGAAPTPVPDTDVTPGGWKVPA